MEAVIKLPDTEPRQPAKKRAPSPTFDPEMEKQNRQKNARKLAVLGAEDGAVKRLESLVFGAEDELLERLVEVTFSPDTVQKSDDLKFSR